MLGEVILGSEMFLQLVQSGKADISRSAVAALATLGMLLDPKDLYT